MAIKKRPVSPRQKMINLMYVVLMAMLALNVSTEVLNGFSIVEESLKRILLRHHRGVLGRLRRDGGHRVRQDQQGHQDL